MPGLGLFVACRGGRGPVTLTPGHDAALLISLSRPKPPKDGDLALMLHDWSIGLGPLGSASAPGCQKRMGLVASAVGHASHLTLRQNLHDSLDLKIFLTLSKMGPKTPSMSSKKKMKFPPPPTCQGVGHVCPGCREAWRCALRKAQPPCVCLFLYVHP